MNSAVCKYPLLRESLRFPPLGVTQQRAEPSRKPPVRKKIMLGKLVGSLLLTILFHGCSLVARPFEWVVGETYGGGPVKIEL